MIDDLISRKSVLEIVEREQNKGDAISEIEKLSSTHQSNMVIPHRNYEYLSDYWCECGWHLGRKGIVNFCANCGKAVKWDG